VRPAGRGFRGKGFRIGWDPGNGAAGPATEKLMARLPGEHLAINAEIDGTFPSHHPDPTVEANLAQLKALVSEHKLDMGFRLRRRRRPHRRGGRQGPGGLGRPDHDDPRPIPAPECPGATIIGDVKASQTLFDRIAELGGKPLMWKTGHSLIKSKMKETGAPLAGEMSGHIFFKHRWYGFDDALYAAVRLIEAIGETGKSLSDLMDEMPRSSPLPKCASRSTKAASSRW
jgi:phosphomannomutase